MILLPLFVLFFWGWGALLLRHRKGDFLLETSVGFFASCYLFFAMAAFGIFTPKALRILLAVVTFLALWPAWLRIRSLASRPAPLSPAELLWASGVAAFLLAAGTACLLPPFAYDGLMYHLPVPLGYLRTGGFEGAPPSLYRSMPMNAELLFGFAFATGGATLAKGLSWLAGALACGWAFRLGRLVSPRAAWLALFLCGTHGSFSLLSSVPYVETFSAFALSAAAALLLGASSLPRRASLLGAAFFFGAGLGVKLTGAAWIVAFGAAVSAFGIDGRGRERPTPRDVTIFFAWTLLLWLPWGAKAWFETGSPVYPFGGNWAATPFLRHEAAGYFAKALSAYLADSIPVRLAFTPWRMLFDPFRLAGGMDIIGAIGWSELILGSPLFILAARKRPAFRVLGAATLAGVFVWCATGPVLRFLVPAVPLWSAGIAAGFAHLEPRLNRIGRNVLLLLLTAGFLHRAYQTAGFHALTGGLDVLTGRMSSNDFEERWNPAAACAKKLNASIPLGAKVLIHGDARSFPLFRAHQASSLYAENPWVSWANAADDENGFARRVRNAGFTHVLWTPREEMRIAGYRTLDFTAEGRKRWAALLLAGKDLGGKTGCRAVALTKG